MPASPTLQEIFEDACALVRQAGGRRGQIEVSPEVAELLERIGEAAAVPFAAAQAPVSRAAQSFAAVEAPASPSGDAREAALAALAAEVAGCMRCGLAGTRTQTVFGSGNAGADLVFVGEAPGANEDLQGLPFVGDAGQLLTDMIEKGMKIPRSSVYICNVVKCRPPGNRNPSPEEKNFCRSFLSRQLEIIQPKVICALGKHAAQTLLDTEDTVGRLRGHWHEYEGIPLRVTYHPSYLLRTPGDKRKAWEDLQEVMKMLGLPIAKG